jgi:hypothetical protein
MLPQDPDLCRFAAQAEAAIENPPARAPAERRKIAPARCAPALRRDQPDA